MSMIGNLLSVNLLALEKLKADPTLIDSYIYPEPENYLDLHKAWAGIHFTLAGTPFGVSADPLSWAVLGGSDIGEDVGYGPARFLTPEQVIAVAKSLDDLSEQQFRARFDQSALNANDVYPSSDWSHSEELEDLVGHYLKLVAYYRVAADKNDAMLIWLS